jgi:zinc transporter, ZIP family
MATATAGRRVPLWVTGIIPIVLIAALVAAFLAFDPIGSLREVPPAEALAVEKTTFDEGVIELEVRNDGPDPVTVAQILVNDAYRDFSVDDAELGRLETTTFEVPYPWDPGLPVTVGFVTSTGLVIEHEVEAAAETPGFDLGTLAIYALLGLYIGVIPVAIGLLWFPALRQIGRRWMDFFLMFTIGLLLFLLIDTVAEALELAAAAPQALDGIGLVATGAIAAILSLTVLEGILERKQGSGTLGALALAYLIAAGIGLHNMGEGLAVGAALATGEVALGTFLVVGFAIHNTTEGLAIVAPLGRDRQRPTLWHFVAMGAVAGLPTVLGAWAGGYAYEATWAALAFGIAAGAIAQVVWKIGEGMVTDGRLRTVHAAAGLLCGFLVMYVTGLVAG